VIFREERLSGWAGAPRVVLVHGMLDRSTTFLPVVERLADLDVVVYDRRGFGHSHAVEPAAASLADHADDLIAVIGDRPATVVGHSFGGNVAMMAAIRRPDLVRSLGLWEPPVDWAPWWWRDLERTRAALAEVEHKYSDRVGPPIERPPAMREAEREATRADRRFVTTAPFELSELAGIPTVCGHGTATWRFQSESVEHLCALLGAERFTITGAWHTAHWHHPDGFAAFVRRAVGLVTPDEPGVDAASGLDDHTSC
jgi:pimeloyl-ACP methyl ester carboxylesterase